MKSLKLLGGATQLLLLTAVAAHAQDAVPATVAKGDTAWMLISTVLVIAMTIPGLALFYAGLVRSKNVLSVLMQVMVGFSLISILWVLFGYTLAFGGSDTGGIHQFFGDFSKLFLGGIGVDSTWATFTKGVEIPELAFVAFQLTFATITPALIVGAIAERMRFGAVMIFLTIWFVFSYLPMAHMVWAGNGLLFGWGALDFAGGTVVHVNAGVAGLVAAIMVGPRIGLGRDNMAPHSLPMTFIGATLLWVGWFGFNAGSNLEANGLTAVALINTIIAPAAAALAWCFGEYLARGHASMLGAASGAVAGLVAITPAAGFSGFVGAIALGAIAGFVCLWAVTWLKARLGYDDSLDVFGVHGVGGMVGAVLTGVVGSPMLAGFGTFESIPAQVIIQIEAVAISIVWSAVVSVIALLVAKSLIGLRVTEAAEREGLDLSTHGERGYN